MSADLLSREGLTERPSGVWDYVSPSRLNLWLRCPLAFRLKYIDGVPTSTSPAMFVGKMVHRGLEMYYRHRQLGITLTVAEVMAGMEAGWKRAAATEGVRFTDLADDELCRKQAAGLVVAYLHQVPIEEPRPLAVEVAVEAPLVDPTTGEDFGLPLVGIIDLVQAETNGPVIADFKTSSRSSEPMEVSHEVQLSSYAYLFRQVYPVEEAALEIRQLVKTKLPQVNIHRYQARTAGHFRRLFAVIRAYLDDLDASRFVYRPGLACGMCDFRETHCRSWLR